MTFLALVGALVLTGALIWCTLAFLYLMVLQAGFAGLDVLGWREWLVVILIAAVLLVGWWLWFDFMASHIVIGVK